MNFKSFSIIASSFLIAAVIALIGRDAYLRELPKKSRANMKQIGVALQAYHDRYDSFPPAYVLGPEGKPWHSWRVLLLPFLEKNDVYEKYRWDEPWNGPQNSKLQSDGPAAYSSPLQKKPGKNLTTYMAIVSRRTMWPAYFSVSYKDVLDGTSNTIQLVENPASNVNWMEPRDLRENEALDLLSPKKVAGKDQSQSVNLIMMVDGGVRFVSNSINRDLFISLLTPQYRKTMVSEDKWPAGLLADGNLADSGTLTLIDSEKLPGVSVVANPDGPLDPEKTAIYCATLQLAWDQLRPGPNQPVFVETQTPTTESLNSHPFPSASLSPDSYFVGVSGLSDEEGSQLHARFRSKFPNASTEAVNVPAGLVSWGGLRILAYIQKTMPFPEVMEKIGEPMMFRSTAVKSFGMLPLKDSTVLTALDQTVLIANYWSDDEFIVILKTETQQRDQIVLAKVAPRDTLRSTWKFVESQIQNSAISDDDSHLHAIDHLQIPVISVGLVAQIKDLVELQIPTNVKPDRYIHDARQTMRFRLDERGAIFESDTYLVVGDDESPVSPPQPKPRNFVFDRPFLIALREQKAEQPYVLAWIGNTDFMDRSPIDDNKKNLP